MDKQELEILRITKPTFILILCFSIIEYLFDITTTFYYLLHLSQLVLIPFLYLFALKAPGTLTKIILSYFIYGIAINSFSNLKIIQLFLLVNLYCHTPVLYLLHKWEMRIYFLLCTFFVSYSLYHTIPNHIGYLIPFTTFSFIWIYHQTLRNRKILFENVVIKEMADMAMKTNHEINNPLHVVNTILKRFEKNLNNEKEKSDIKKARENLKKIEDYVKELHDLDSA
ncbi:MAG: hypothetical protein H6622_06580 [Halobacteriovoraceae bacterium]|nr:hypothetical protein [Halobacteriovoraceae bacterium]